MLELLFLIFLGWPGILVTVVLAGVGLFRSDDRLSFYCGCFPLPAGLPCIADVK
jgi:hypothetical protein